jgi:hypothetical protein
MEHGRLVHGFGWFTKGSVAPSRERRGRRRIRTPKRYPAIRPFTVHEQRVIAQLRAARLAKGA